MPEVKKVSSADATAAVRRATARQGKSVIKISPSQRQAILSGRAAKRVGSK